MKPKPSPFKIEIGIPAPRGNYGIGGYFYELRMAVKKLKVSNGTDLDESFLMQNSGTDIYSAAKVEGVKIKTRKINGTGYRVWRIK